MSALPGEAAAAERQARRDAYILAIVQGYIAKNSIPQDDTTRAEMVQQVVRLADEMVAELDKPKKKNP